MNYDLELILAFRHACLNGHLEVAKLLSQLNRY